MTLTQDEAKTFREQGYLGPFTAVDEAGVAKIRAHIEDDLLTSDGPSPNSRLQSRHMDSRVIADLATHPEIIGRMRALYGDDLIMWATNFFSKEPGGAEIPWHQDLSYWPLEPLINISAWVAIDTVTVENACVQVIPGSHKAVYPSVKADEGMAFGKMTDPDDVDADQLVNVELRPGEFVLFNRKLLHHSNTNASTMRRMGMSIRSTLPMVDTGQDNRPCMPATARGSRTGVTRWG